MQGETKEVDELYLLINLIKIHYNMHGLGGTAAAAAPQNRIRISILTAATKKAS